MRILQMILAAAVLIGTVKLTYADEEPNYCHEGQTENCILLE